MLSTIAVPTTYVKPAYHLVHGLQNKIAALSIEHDTAERLLSMGFTRAGTTDLAQHVEYCKNQMKVWQKQLDEQNKKKGKKVVLHH